MAENAFMVICLGVGSALILEGLGLDLGWKVGVGIGMISAALGIVLAAIATGGRR